TRNPVAIAELNRCCRLGPVPPKEQTGSHNPQGCRPPNAAALLSFGSLGGRPRNTPPGFIIPFRPTVAGRPPTGPGVGRRAEPRRLCPGSGQAVLRDMRERGTA